MLRIPTALAVFLALAAMTVGLMPPPEAAAEPTQTRCASNIVLYVHGTYGSSKEPTYVATKNAMEAGASSRGKSLSFRTIHYPATFGTVGSVLGTSTLSLSASVKAGRRNLKNAIRDRLRSCPGSNITIVGYSQGAGVVGDVAEDVLAGRDGFSPLDISAAHLISDPMRNPGENVLPENGRKGQGIIGASRNWSRHGGKVFNYCKAYDTVCDAPRSVAKSGLKVKEDVWESGENSDANKALRKELSRTVKDGRSVLSLTTYGSAHSVYFVNPLFLDAMYKAI